MTTNTAPAARLTITGDDARDIRSHVRLTRDQQRCLAFALLGEAGTIVEFCSERFEGTTLEGVPASVVADQLARWLRRLPGDVWDMRLPDPAHLA